MKLTIKRIIAAIVFFSIFFSIIMYAGYIVRPYENGAYNYNNWQYFYEEDDNTHNVIAIGSSAIYRYWNPILAYNEQGITSFIIGSTRQPFGAVPYIIEEAMKSQTPDLIVVDVRSLLNQRIYELENSENGQPDMQSWCFGIVASGMKYSSTRFNMIHELYIETEGDSELYWHIPVLKYHSLEYKLPLKERINRIFPKKDPYKSTYLNANVEVITKQSEEKELYGEYYLTIDQKNAIDNVVQMAEKYEVELLFVSTPYFMDKGTASMQKSFQDYVEQKNYPYVDFNDYVGEIGLDGETDFYNSIHTNVVGAQKFTSYFSEYLVDNYEFDNVNLTEQQVDEWDEAVNNWNKKNIEFMNDWEENCIKAKAEESLKQNENSVDMSE